MSASDTFTRQQWQNQEAKRLNGSFHTYLNLS